MMTFGYAKSSYYAGDSTFMIKVRIPSIHGPYKQSDAGGQRMYTYVTDDDLPYYPSILLPRTPQDGDVVVLANTNTSETNPDFIVIGLTGASYISGSNI